MQERLIKTIVFHPELAEMDVEYYGNYGGITLKQCLACGDYHPIWIGACPRTGKVIIEVARRQAEEENRLREKAIREVAAVEAKDKYLLESGFYGNCINWKNSWRHFIALFGGIAVYLILAVVFGGLRGGSLIAIFVCVVWLIFWGWLDKRYRKSLRDKADTIYRRMLGGEELLT